MRAGFMGCADSCVLGWQADPPAGGRRALLAQATAALCRPHFRPVMEHLGPVVAGGGDLTLRPVLGHL